MKYPEKPSERFLKTNTQIQIQYTQMFSWRIQMTMASTQLFLPHSQQSLFELPHFIPKVLLERQDWMPSAGVDRVSLSGCISALVCATMVVQLAGQRPFVQYSCWYRLNRYDYVLPLDKSPTTSVQPYSKSSSKNLNHIYRSIYLASLHILPPYPSRQIPRCPSHRDRRGCAKNHWKGGHENCEI